MRYAPVKQGSSAIVVGGSIQLEFKKLSELSGNPRYATVADDLMHCIRPHCEIGACPKAWRSDCTPANTWHTATIQSAGDSFYEYLLKQWLLKGRTEDFFLSWWNHAGNNILYHGKYYNGHYIPHYAVDGWYFEHLGCFTAGLYALSFMSQKDRDVVNATAHLKAATEIGETCRFMHQVHKNGLPMERLLYGEKARPQTDNSYRLRPEIVESYFYLFRATGDAKYREWAWELFVAANKHLRDPETGAFCGAQDVSQNPITLLDRMETFWTAETLKYMLLIFSEGDELLSLSEHVLTTEAHPLKVMRG